MNTKQLCKQAWWGKHQHKQYKTDTKQYEAMVKHATNTQQ